MLKKGFKIFYTAIKFSKKPKIIENKFQKNFIFKCEKIHIFLYESSACYVPIIL